MCCKITAIFADHQMYVIIRHSFCTKHKYSDENVIFVTKYICKEFCHTKQIDKIMNKLPAIFATLRSNLSFVIVLPMFWLSFVLLYQPSKLVELLDMGNGMLNFNATIIMCILLGVMIISRGVLMVIHHTLELNWFKLMVW